MSKSFNFRNDLYLFRSARFLAKKLFEFFYTKGQININDLPLKNCIWITNRLFKSCQYSSNTTNTSLSMARPSIEAAFPRFTAICR